MKRWMILMVLVICASSSVAHVVPPEKLHPVAEAYRRANFVLGLNPVQWDVVRNDVSTITTHGRTLENGLAETFSVSIHKTIEDATREPDVDSDVEPMPRAVAASKVFRTLTRGVAAMGAAHLALAVERIDDRQAALASARDAQGILAAFDDAIQAGDPAAYRRIGQSWLTITSSLGSEGLLGVGASGVDREKFNEAARLISRYYIENYVDGYSDETPRSERDPLIPWPLHSESYDTSAKLPIKLPPGSEINKQLPRPRQILGMASRGVDEGETTLIALGDMAFDSPYIFGEPARSLGISCNTCHNKSITNPKLFIPGLSTVSGGLDVSNSFFAPHANNGHFDPLDTPDLRGIRFTAPYGRNGRFGSLREFVRNVIVNEFNGPEPSPVLLDGMIAYMLEFEFLSNPALDAHGQLTVAASDAARRGEKIFRKPFAQMGGMSCASCHIPEANFLDHKRHDIGTVNGYEPYSRDRHMDTPTLLSAKYTAPYFHDGSQPTLRAVNEWFNDRYKLSLTEQELDDLTAYVETVGDGVEAYEDTLFTLEAELEEFSFFISAYEFLAARGHWGEIGATCQTIAHEIRAHKWDLQDWDHMPVLDRMAEIMDRAYAAYEAGDYTAIRRLVDEYRNVYEEHAEVLK